MTNSIPDDLIKKIKQKCLDHLEDPCIGYLGIEQLNDSLKELLLSYCEIITRKKKMNRIEFIVQIRHLAWISYQLGADQEYNLEINDDQLTSLKDGVRYALENPDRTPEENHENWIEMKISQGWLYGPIKDFKKKTHPDLVPFDKLPTVEARKDTMDAIAHDIALNIWNDLFSEKKT